MRFAVDLERAKADRTPVMALRRDWDGGMDDVVVENVTTFRAEMMSERDLWMACYFSNGERTTFNVRAEKGRTLVYDVGEMPAAWLDFDDREAGVKSGSDRNASDDAVRRAHGVGEHDRSIRP